MVQVSPANGGVHYGKSTSRQCPHAAAPSSRVPSVERTRAVAAKHSLNPKTVAKWRKRTHTTDAPMGPRQRRTAALSAAEEAMVVEFRRRTLLPLDDVLGIL